MTTGESSQASGGPNGPPIRFTVGPNNTDGEQDDMREFKPSQSQTVAASSPVEPSPRRILLLKRETLVAMRLIQSINGRSSSATDRCF